MLVNDATGVLFSLTSYKGLAFFALSDEPLPLPGRAEVIDARKIWAPS